MQRRNRKKRLGKFILLVFFIFFTGISLLLFFHLKAEPKVMSAKTSDAKAFQQESISPIPTEVPLPDNSPGLTNAIQDALSGTHGSYGIVIKNLKTGEGYHQNEKTLYESGSLYKLWLMATVFQQIEQGQIYKTDMLEKDVISLNNEFGLSPDPNEQTDGTLSLSISDALYQSITISSNNAALLLLDKIQVGAIESFLERNHFNDSRVGIKNKPPVTTAYDISAFLEKLYNGKLASPTDTDRMLSLLKQQRLNSKLPKYLPYDIKVAHKTGELDNFSHDAGIVYSPYGDYIIVVLSQSDDPELANERISLVSQAVYNYFSEEPISLQTSPTMQSN